MRALPAASESGVAPLPGRGTTSSDPGGAGPSGLRERSAGGGDPAGGGGGAGGFHVQYLRNGISF